MGIEQPIMKVQPDKVYYINTLKNVTGINSMAFKPQLHPGYAAAFLSEYDKKGSPFAGFTVISADRKLVTGAPSVALTQQTNPTEEQNVPMIAHIEDNAAHISGKDKGGIVMEMLTRCTQTAMKDTQEEYELEGKYNKSLICNTHAPESAVPTPASLLVAPSQLWSAIAHSNVADVIKHVCLTLACVRQGVLQRTKKDNAAGIDEATAANLAVVHPVFQLLEASRIWSVPRRGDQVVFQASTEAAASQLRSMSYIKLGIKGQFDLHLFPKTSSGDSMFKYSLLSNPLPGASSFKAATALPHVQQCVKVSVQNGKRLADSGKLQTQSEDIAVYLYKSNGSTVNASSVGDPAVQANTSVAKVVYITTGISLEDAPSSLVKDKDRHGGSHYLVKPVNLVSAILLLVGSTDKHNPLMVDSRQIVYQAAQRSLLGKYELPNKQPGQTTTLLAALFLAQGKVASEADFRGYLAVQTQKATLIPALLKALMALPPQQAPQALPQPESADLLACLLGSPEKPNAAVSHARYPPMLTPDHQHSRRGLKSARREVSTHTCCNAMHMCTTPMHVEDVMQYQAFITLHIASMAVQSHYANAAYIILDKMHGCCLNRQQSLQQPRHWQHLFPREETLPQTASAQLQTPLRQLQAPLGATGQGHNAQQHARQPPAGQLTDNAAYSPRGHVAADPEDMEQ